MLALSLAHLWPQKAAVTHDISPNVMAFRAERVGRGANIKRPITLSMSLCLNISQKQSSFIIILYFLELCLMATLSCKEDWEDEFLSSVDSDLGTEIGYLMGN